LYFVNESSALRLDAKKSDADFGFVAAATDWEDGYP
jgi:hypothetical protein